VRIANKNNEGPLTAHVIMHQRAPLFGNKEHTIVGVTDGIQHMYRKFIADMTRIDIEKKEVTCPLCQRLFDETSVS